MANGQDRQKNHLAGEFFVAAELLKRGLQTSITLGNAKAIDLFAHNERTGRTYCVQVKTVGKPNGFDIRFQDIERESVYVFVILNNGPVQADRPVKLVEYFVVPGRDLIDHSGEFGPYFRDYPKRPGIEPKYLVTYRDKWAEFG